MESHANTELGATSRAFQSMFEQGGPGEYTHMGDTSQSIWRCGEMGNSLVVNEPERRRKPNYRLLFSERVTHVTDRLRMVSPAVNPGRGASGGCPPGHNSFNPLSSARATLLLSRHVLWLEPLCLPSTDHPTADGSCCLGAAPTTSTNPNCSPELVF